MKNCKICGASFEDNAAFCVMCGAKLDNGVQNNLQAPPVASQMDYNSILLGEQTAYSPREMFFKAASSTKALVAVILLAVSFVVTVINVIFNIFIITDGALWAEALKENSLYGIDTALFENIINVMSAVFSIIMLLFLVPIAFNVFGALFIFINSKKRLLDTKGLTLIKINNVIFLAFYSVTALLLILSSLGLGSGLIVIFAFCAIGLGPMILLQICFINTVNKMKAVVKYDQNISIPTFVPVIIIIGCGISALLSLSTTNILSILFTSFGIVGNILFAICMFDYNNSIALMRVKNIYDKPVNRGNGL